jgi:glucosamine-6-phosphate deaminase
MEPLWRATYDRLQVEVYPDRGALGRAAAEAVGACLRQLLGRFGRVRVAFAAAPSQEEFLAALVLQPGIAWERVVAFHLDDYVGLPAEAPQRFVHWLAPRLFDRLPFAAVHRIDGTAADPEAEARRYEALLRAQPLHVVCLGIGENGHLAFNDPPVADFADPRLVKVVELDDRCRLQQVHDGAFATLEAVPRRAITLTVPAILGARRIFAVVPAAAKAEAVRAALLGPVATSCPASILRRHAAARLFLDVQSAALLRTGVG